MAEKSISVDEIKKIIDKKQRQSEIVGVNLFFNDSGVGMSLLAYTTSKIMFSLNINRKVVGNTKDKITDITWYFNNIIIKLQENNCNIDYFQIEDYRY